MLYLKNKKEGFSLLELILAIAIFSLGSVAMSTLLIDSNITTRLGTERTEALFYAKEGIEAVRSIRDNSWAGLEIGTHGLDNSGVAWAFSGALEEINGKYTRTVEVSSVSTSTKNVSVNISWNITSGRTASTTLETVLTNWRNS
jgi:prepilin-type N-terminal cleavage/methylation domain-containing protein